MVNILMWVFFILTQLFVVGAAGGAMALKRCVDNEIEDKKLHKIAFICIIGFVVSFSTLVLMISQS